MRKLATVTSKRQVTIPIEIFKKLQLMKGEKVIFLEKDGDVKLKKATNLVENLAGSVAVPKDKKSVSVEEAIAQAKQKHFSQKEE